MDVHLAAVVLILSSSLTAQLAFRQQPRLHVDVLLFTANELQQLVQRQATATCNSVQATVSAFHVALFVRTVRRQTQTLAGVHVVCVKYALLTYS